MPFFKKRENPKNPGYLSLSYLWFEFVRACLESARRDCLFAFQLLLIVNN